MIERTARLLVLTRLLRDYPVVALLGARQIGKTTLARQLAAAWRGRTAYFDLEDPAVRRRLSEPMLELRGLRGLALLDEVQRVPGIFEVLRVLSDRPGCPMRFLVLGSASPDLLRQSSETLAGRIHYTTLAGLGLDEIGAERMRRLWLRGGFPRSFVARSEQVSAQWRRDFVRTFLERDVPQLGVTIPAQT
ncbi:MAG: ATP-binding protein, partial [Betaproteobacteria bacterium]|nr:ATP-binding protein [Betaproteobacteria bacterium]